MRLWGVRGLLSRRLAGSGLDSLSILDQSEERGGPSRLSPCPGITRDTQVAEHAYGWLSMYEPQTILPAAEVWGSPDY